MTITRALRILCMAALGIVGAVRPAAADWLLTPFVGLVFNVRTAEATDLLIPAEKFKDSRGFGLNLASAFPARANLGFEVDFAYYPEALRDSDQFGTLFASKLVMIGTNFFYSPAVPRFRPYFSVGPSFGYRLDHSDATVSTPSGWGIGVNGGAGVMAFVTQRIGIRADARYFRNLGDFYDLRDDVEGRRTGWKDLQFVRVFVGATFVP
jgi:outer membrane protein W